MNKIFRIFFVLTILVSSCSKEKIDNYQEVYEVEMIGTWSSATHPTNFPSNAHFSAMVGLSHVEGLDVINEGLTATEGIKEMAETGATETLDNEFLILHNQTYALDRVVGKPFNSPGSNKVEIGVERGRHVVSFFSMIAPSPDWFVAVSTSLIDPLDGKWYDKVIVYATAYDAGTDIGIDFNSENIASDTITGIRRINTGPLTEGTDSVKSLAKFIFRRVKK